MNSTDTQIGMLIEDIARKGLSKSSQDFSPFLRTDRITFVSPQRRLTVTRHVNLAVSPIANLLGLAKRESYVIEELAAPVKTRGRETDLLWVAPAGNAVAEPLKKHYAVKSRTLRKKINRIFDDRFSPPLDDRYAKEVEQQINEVFKLIV